jgi:hypothetical protein
MLSYAGLRQLIVSARDEELPLSQDTCVSSIAKVTPGPGPVEFRVKTQWDADEPFHLWFQFQSARSIEIDAETVELRRAI